MRLLILTTAIVLTTGCSALKNAGESIRDVIPDEPWVKPYEREYLADPLMQPQRLSTVDSFRVHVHEIREGARGARSSGGGGCGCN